jgi:hypothetical protein
MQKSGSFEALLEAKRRWGELGCARKRTTTVPWSATCEVGVIVKPETRVDGVYPWMWPMEVYGSGPSWVQAFKAADEYQPTARGETRPGHPVGGPHL